MTSSLIAHRALTIVERMTGVRLPDVEAIPTALHLVNAQMGRPDIGRTMQTITLMGEVLRAVAAYVDAPLRPGSMATSRFVTHLRYLVARGEQTRVLTEGMGHLLDALRITHPEQLRCATRCRAIIEDYLATTQSDDELVYLTLHIVRLIHDVGVGGQRDVEQGGGS